MFKVWGKDECVMGENQKPNFRRQTSKGRISKEKFHGFLPIWLEPQVYIAVYVNYTQWCTSSLPIHPTLPFAHTVPSAWNALSATLCHPHSQPLSSSQALTHFHVSSLGICFWPLPSIIALLCARLYTVLLVINCQEPVRHSTRDKVHEEGGSAYAKAGSSLRSPPGYSRASTPKKLESAYFIALCSHLWLYWGLSPTTISLSLSKS